jgi:hypothetical protein
MNKSTQTDILIIDAINLDQVHVAQTEKDNTPIIIQHNNTIGTPNFFYFYY